MENREAAEKAAAEMGEQEKALADSKRSKVKVIDKTTEQEKLDLRKTFYFSVESAVDGKQYEGDFTIRKMGLMQLSQLGTTKARLSGGLAVEPHYDYLNQQIAQCMVSIEKSPPWWDLNKMVDTEILGAIHKEVISFENSFRKVARE